MGIWQDGADMLMAETQHRKSSQIGIDGVTLMADERVEASVSVGEGDESGGGDGETLHLTNRRIIRVSGEAGKRSMAIAAVDDVHAVELTRRPAEGYRSYVWAGLAMFVAFMLWRIIDDQLISIVAAAIVALMGVYLIVDRLTLRGEQALVIKTPANEIRIEARGESGRLEAEALITRLFEVKEERSAAWRSDARRFSPR